MAISKDGGSNPTAVIYNNWSVSEVLYNGTHVWPDIPIKGGWPNVLRIELNGGSWENISIDIMSDNYPSNNTTYPIWSPAQRSFNKVLCTDLIQDFFGGKELREFYSYPSLVTNSSAGLDPQFNWPEGYRYLASKNSVDQARIINFLNYYYYGQGAVDITFHVRPKTITYNDQTFKVPSYSTAHAYVWSLGDPVDPKLNKDIMFSSDSLQNRAKSWWNNDETSHEHQQANRGGIYNTILGFERTLIVNY